MSDDAGSQDIGGARRRRVAEADAAKVTADAVDNAGGDRPRRRRNRKPFGNLDQKLAYPERAGYHRHWFNDVPGRLMRAGEAGYDQVKDGNGQPVHMVVGVARGGGALTAYLHEIPLEDYLEDMAANDSVVENRLHEIRQGQFAKPKGRDADLQYAGSTRGPISIESNTRR
jgi:hypothetical protein